MPRALILFVTAATVLGCGTEGASTLPVEPTPSEPQAPIPEVPAEPDEAPAELVDLLHAVESTVIVSSAFHGAEAQVPRLADGDLASAWNSESENLVGAWIELRLPEGAQVDHLLMTNGYTHTSRGRDLYLGNHRIRRVRVLHNGEEVGFYPLALDDQTLQRIPASGSGGNWRIQIVDVVPGDRPTWRELCVSELRVMGTAPGADPGSTTPSARIASDAPSIEEAMGGGEGDLVDLLRAAPTTLRVSSSAPEGSSIADVTDGDTSTGWTAASRAGEWIEAELPDAAMVARIELASRSLGDSEEAIRATPRIRRVRVVHEDVPLGEYDIEPGLTAFQTLHVMGSGGRWRIEILALTSGGDAVGVGELRFMGHAEGAEAGTHVPTVEIAPPQDGASAVEQEVLALATDPSEGAIFGEASGLRVSELSIGGAIENRQISDARSRFSRGTDARVYCLVRIDNPERVPTGIYMAWERVDRESDESGRLMNVPAQPRYVTFGFTGTQGRPGRYRCTIRSQSRELLGSVAYELTE